MCDGDNPYQGDVLADDVIGREGMDHTNCPLEPLDEGAFLPNFMQGLYLLLENIDDVIGGFAICEGVDDLMLK